MGRFTKIPEETFSELQLDAGVLLNQFDPDNPAIADGAIITATTGGINATCVPTFSDMGEDVDNCPVNMKELKHLDSWECKLGFTALGTSPASIKMALGCADIDSNNASKIIPRRNLAQTDFAHIWWVGDRADGGLVAIQLLNALSTGGFSLQTTKAGKGQISCELTGHVSINDQDTVPMLFYSAEGSDFKSIGVTSFASSTAGKTAITIDYTPASGESLKYKLGSSSVAVAKDDVLTTGWTSWNGSDDITAVTGQYITIAVVTTSDNKAVGAGSIMVTASAS